MSLETMLIMCDSQFLIINSRNQNHLRINKQVVCFLQRDDELKFHFQLLQSYQEGTIKERSKSVICVK